MKSSLALLLPLALLAPATAAAPKTSLQRLLQDRLPALGHRNWIVIADSAYPLQTAPGIETITVKDSQLSAVKQTLQVLAKTKHVRPTIYLDKELAYVPEKHASGITKFRGDLTKLLTGKKAQKLPHEEIIAKLDEAGKTFKVLLIKTPHIQPYTSVFFQLECGYWSDQAEKDLREAMKKGAGGQ